MLNFLKNELMWGFKLLEHLCKAHLWLINIWWMDISAEMKTKLMRHHSICIRRHHRVTRDFRECALQAKLKAIYAQFNFVEWRNFADGHKSLIYSHALRGEVYLWAHKKERKWERAKEGASAVCSKPSRRSAPIPSPRQPWGNRHGNSHLGALVNMKVGAERRRRGCRLNGTAAGSMSQQVGGKREMPNRKGLECPSTTQVLCLCSFHSQRKLAQRTRRKGSLWG